MSKLRAPIAVAILDGWGIGDDKNVNNAIAQAKTPHMTLLKELYPHTSLACSGAAVGLPDGQMGNSEVGHLNIGAGRIVYQEFTRISKAIRDGEFFDNKVLCRVIDEVKAANGKLHIMGLVSDGGVHSHIDHLYALLKLAKQRGVTKVYVHAFLDGRDVPPSSAKIYLAAVEQKMAELAVGKMATISGRYYAMDRDKRWERIEKAYAAMVYREGVEAPDALTALEEAYTRGETDEFVSPTVLTSCKECSITKNDGVIFFNFRPDRARELTRTFVDQDFIGFERKKGFFPLYFATMTDYDETLDTEVAYPPQYLHNTLGEVLSRQGYRQLRIAETEKYAHVTFFFNGGEEKPFKGENRVLIPSPKVATYDLQPEMSAHKVTKRLLEELKKGENDLIILNFAYGDMVGHTGKLAAAIQAVEIVDTCIGKVGDAMREMGGVTLITADHGNCEVMVDPVSGEPFTAHTTNPVPFILVSEQHCKTKLRQGALSDIAPTVLDIAGIKQPEEMTGKSLIIK